METLLKPTTLPLKQLGGAKKDNLQILHRHCHDIKTRDDLLAIKRHKSIKEWDKTMKQFNELGWEWEEDIPTLVKGTQ
jgi:RNA-directed DNA polymerase